MIKFQLYSLPNTYTKTSLESWGICLRSNLVCCTFLGSWYFWKIRYFKLILSHGNWCLQYLNSCKMLIEQIFSIFSTVFCFQILILSHLFKNFYLLILERVRESLFHFFMHSLVASCMCTDPGSNLKPWHIQTTL